MIQKEMESGPSEPKKYIKRSFPSENSKFSVMSQPETALVFDAAKIIHRFREFKEVQHEQLAGINLPEELKVHLFGFSPSHYLLNRTNLSDLIIENHPLDGRIIMAKQKYKIYLEQKYQEKQIKGTQQESMASNKKNYGVLDMISVSSLSVNKAPQLSQASMLISNASQAN